MTIQPTSPDIQSYWPELLCLVYGPDSAVLNFLGVTFVSSMCLNLTSLKQILSILVKKIKNKKCRTRFNEGKYVILSNIDLSYEKILYFVYAITAVCI